MEVIVDRACGLDVHKDNVVVCIMGNGIKKEITTYRTMTNDLLRLKGPMSSCNITLETSCYYRRK